MAIISFILGTLILDSVRYCEENLDEVHTNPVLLLTIEVFLIVRAVHDRLAWHLYIHPDGIAHYFSFLSDSKITRKPALKALRVWDAKF